MNTLRGNVRWCLAILTKNAGRTWIIEDIWMKVVTSTCVKCKNLGRKHLWEICFFWSVFWRGLSRNLLQKLIRSKWTNCDKKPTFTARCAGCPFKGGCPQLYRGYHRSLPKRWAIHWRNRGPLMETTGQQKTAVRLDAWEIVYILDMAPFTVTVVNEGFLGSPIKNDCSCEGATSNVYIVAVARL